MINGYLETPMKAIISLPLNLKRKAFLGPESGSPYLKKGGGMKEVIIILGIVAFIGGFFFQWKKEQKKRRE